MACSHSTRSRPAGIALRSGRRFYGEVSDAKLDDTSDPVEITIRGGPSVVLHVRDAAGSPIAARRRDLARSSSRRHDDTRAPMKAPSRSRSFGAGLLSRAPRRSVARSSSSEP
jgi:hypothetical protein